MTLAASFARPLVGDGTLPALTVGSYPTVGGYWFPEDGTSEPEFDQRTAFADDSPHVAGSLATQSVTGLGTWAGTVYTLAASEGDLKAQKRALEACVRQFSYVMSLTIVGSPDDYTCLAGRISWGEYDSGMAHDLIARAVITIPVQPLGA